MSSGFGGLTSSGGTNSTAAGGSSIKLDTSTHTATTTSGSGGSGGFRGGTSGTGGSGGVSGGTGGSGGSGVSGGSGGTGGSVSGGTGGTGGGAPKCEPGLELCDGLDNDCNNVIDEEDACPTDCRGFFIEEHSYMFCGQATTPDAANTLCGEQQMVLVEIDSQEENAALVSIVAPLFEELAEDNGQQPAFWIGASDASGEGDWVWRRSDTQFWSGNDNSGYSNWGEGRPNNASTGEDCAVVYLVDGEEGPAGSWNDLRCSEEYSFVCEVY